LIKRWWNTIKSLFVSNVAHKSNDVVAIIWQANWSTYLNETVAFYRTLTESDKVIFEKRVRLFLETTPVEAGQFEVSDKDRLLVASSAIIPVWGFPEWHYFNVKKVFLLPASFNEQFECGQPDSLITGMVGTGAMSGKLALSQPALHLGFKNTKDKQNVGIHEFVHLVDMADGDCDGFPERLKKYAFSIPWFELVEKKIAGIDSNSSNIRDYGATNKAEFLAVTSEYFFERPMMMKKRHPKLYQALSGFYQQDVSRIADDIKPRKKGPCACGSGKRYKHCCLPES
jgi:Mlc titration factor MtfA (ptsG expression regulator)